MNLKITHQMPESWTAVLIVQERLRKKVKKSDLKPHEIEIHPVIASMLPTYAITDAP